MTTALTTESLSNATAESLGLLSDYGFRYFRSYGHFRRKNKNGFSYIAINSVTHNRGAYHLTFYPGVQITEVEAWLLNLLGDARAVNHHDRTIWNYTVNIGPTSPNWRHPIRGTWTLTTLEEFNDRSAEISEFVRDLALPFVDEHQDPVALRRTMIETPGRATNIWPYRPILAIDCLYGSPEQTEADIALLDKRYERYAPQPRKEFDHFVSVIRKTMKLKAAIGRSLIEPSVGSAGAETAMSSMDQAPRLNTDH
jgi:hypothetical protein